MAGMHEPGWRDKNYEEAMEAWRAEAKVLLESLRICGSRLETEVTAADFARIKDLLGELDQISDDLFAIRNGPENPNDV